jgi:ribonuclease T2
MQRALLVCLFVLGPGASAFADANGTPAQCRIPDSVSPVAVTAPPPHEISNTEVTWFSLAMTWSPEWCRTRMGSATDKLQCNENRFGWVLHGLWPNSSSGAHPRYCRLATQVSPSTLRQHLCMTPSAALIQNEWTAHGVCYWSQPEEYFERASVLWNGLVKPDPSVLADGDGRISAGALRSAFAAANPGLAQEAIHVGANLDGRLMEVRVCFDKSFAMAACPGITRGAADSAVLAVQPIPQ